jgi:UDP-glucose 4-epimerase
LGDITPTRDFLYVKDTAHGFITVAEHKEKLLGKTINIGTGREISIQELALITGNLLGIKPNFKSDPNKERPDKSEVRQLCCDSSQIESLTDWRPKYTLEIGLEETIKFYKEFGHKIFVDPRFT